MADYKRVFERISLLLNGEGPSSFMSDFEQSAQKGLLHVFPAVRIESCLFHLSQSVVRHVRSGNGVDFYQRNQDFRVFVRSLPALAFLPSDLVERAFDHLMESADLLPDGAREAAFKIGDYFGPTYVVRRINTVRRRDALFPPESWNCYDLVLSDRPRTNNSLEGWHSAFRANFSGGATPPFSQVIRAIRREEIAAIVSVRNKLLDPTAPLIGRTRNSKYVKNDARIKALVELFPSNPSDAKLIAHLKAVQYHISFANLPSSNPVNPSLVIAPPVPRTSSRLSSPVPSLSSAFPVHTLSPIPLYRSPGHESDSSLHLDRPRSSHFDRVCLLCVSVCLCDNLSE
ncbi:hypothetical protein L596_010317 [Steinernema carpocapsae]|uniref:MULE transposase domain-containing protein n=1 Tax=Steinernema carpocapsae TaxID=34508 RepID=A0A4U5PIP9_STECR|nr:hypothetical protein L596_010317 [Steinernema carpocapsae]